MAIDVTVAAPVGLGSYPNMSNGSFTSDGNATSVSLGYNPRYIEVVNVTDNVVWKWMQGMPPLTTVKSAAAAQTMDATGAILVGLDAGLEEPGSAFLLSAAACATGKTIVWTALG